MECTSQSQLLALVLGPAYLFDGNTNAGGGGFLASVSHHSFCYRAWLDWVDAGYTAFNFFVNRGCLCRCIRPAQDAAYRRDNHGVDVGGTCFVYYLPGY